MRWGATEAHSRLGGYLASMDGVNEPFVVTLGTVGVVPCERNKRLAEDFPLTEVASDHRGSSERACARARVPAVNAADASKTLRLGARSPGPFISRNWRT